MSVNWDTDGLCLNEKNNAIELIRCKSLVNAFSVWCEI